MKTKYDAEIERKIQDAKDNSRLEGLRKDGDSDELLRKAAYGEISEKEALAIALGRARDGNN